MADDRPRRLAALVELLVARNLDGLLVSSLPNIRYLTGFSGTNALLLVSRRAVVLLTDFRYETQSAEECRDVAMIRIERTSLWTGLWEALAETSDIEIVAFESAHLMHKDFERLLQNGGRWRWRPETDLVESLRERKTAEEVTWIRAAADIGGRALHRTLESVRAGMSELQVAGLLEKHLRDEGSEAHPFPPIIASGPRTALPHARASARAIAPDDFLLLDFGATAGGYCSDITRVVVVGRASQRQREVYDAVLEANAAARAGIHAGMKGREGDALARRVLDGRGLGDWFGHGLGHGLGLEVHEAPRLSKAVDTLLPEGAVVTIEPGAYLPEWGGVRIEDDVYLSAAGAELLTDIPRELTELA